MGWVASVGNVNAVTPDVLRVQSYLKESGVTAATFVGFCWGAKV